MFIANQLQSYSVLDTGNGEKLENVGGVILQRPDPQVIWERTLQKWHPHAVYERSTSGGGSWRFIRKVPESWVLPFQRFKMTVRPTGFKHIGVFPEQSVNWDYMYSQIIKRQKQTHMLNLFAYTGGTTLAGLAAGASVVHVDAAKSINDWARDNVRLSGLENAPVRFIADDCRKFVQREQRRGNQYDAIVMDPPSYGRSGNSVWKIEDDLFALIKDCVKLLSDTPLFFIVSSYTTGLSSMVTRNMLSLCLGSSGHIEAGTLTLPQKGTPILLPCGTTARWQP